MKISSKRRNSPLSYLRQTVTTLPSDSYDPSLVLYLSALMLIMRNNRLGNLINSKAEDPLDIKQLKASDLRQLVRLLQAQLTSFSNVVSNQLQFDTADDKTLMRVWQSLFNKQLNTLWQDETILGYIYQFQCLPERAKSLSNLSKSDKSIDAKTLISFTQLYTPDWIADFLLENTILPQWNEKLPVEKLTVLDPACGAGHFLVKAFNLLSKLYVADGATEKEACQAICKQNLYGTDIDLRALAVTALSLFVRSLSTNTIDTLQLHNLASATSNSEDPLDNLLGSLNRQWPGNHPLANKYRAVVTNPPYIGRKLLDRSLKQALKINFPASHNDFANAFLERCLELVEPEGMVGLITQASILSLPSYTELRKNLLEKTIDTCVELGPGAFPLQGGEKINSLMLVVKNHKQPRESKHTCRFIDLRHSKDKSRDLAQPANVYNVCPNVLRENTNHVFSYRSPAIVSTVLKEAIPLASQAEIRQGLATTDNHRFLRYWWDVDKDLIGERWFPYAKGAGVRRWHNPIKHLVNWQNGGQEIKDAVNKAYPYLNGKSAWVVKNEKYYFRKGLTFSFVGGQDLAVRYMPAGCIFDVAGSAIFLNEKDIFLYLAYLNSSFIGSIARSLNPSINFQVGDLKKLPIIEFTDDEKIQLSNLGQRCVAIKEWLNGFDPSIFSATPPEELKDVLAGRSVETCYRAYASKHQQLIAELKELEQDLNHTVLNAAARQWRLAGTDLTTLTNWSVCQAPVKEFCLDARAFAKVSFYHLLKSHIEHMPLRFGLDGVDELPVKKENAVWLSQQLKANLNKYLIGQFNADHCKMFSGSPQLVCRAVPGNGHAVIFSTQTLRDMQKKNLPKDKSADLNMLTDLAAELSSTQDWTGKHLLSYL